MRYVKILNEDQVDMQALHRVRSRLVSIRTRLINQMRALCIEYGVAIRNGAGVFKVDHPCVIADESNDLPVGMRRAEAAQLEGIAAALDAARAGNRSCDIAAAFMGVLVKYGIHREGRMGYPVGLSYPPDWGERSASIRTEDETVLEPGMTFHFMPALWMETWGLETTETILIRETGAAEPLCNVERKLFVKG